MWTANVARSSVEAVSVLQPEILEKTKKADQDTSLERIPEKGPQSVPDQNQSLDRILTKKENNQ